jgi:hypothetical protein
MHACSGQCNASSFQARIPSACANAMHCVVWYDLVSINYIYLSKHIVLVNLSRGSCIRFHGQQLQSNMHGGRFGGFKLHWLNNCCILFFERELIVAYYYERLCCMFELASYLQGVLYSSVWWFARSIDVGWTVAHMQAKTRCSESWRFGPWGDAVGRGTSYIRHFPHGCWYTESLKLIL